MANQAFGSKTTLIGGGATALDSIDGAGLVDGDIAIVPVSGVLYVYRLNATSGAADDGFDTIAPDTNAGNKRWIRQNPMNIINRGTAQASTSGTSIDFTSIPAWVKRITIMLNGVSTNGTSNLRVQIGTGGSPTTSGYVSTVIRTNAGGVGSGNSTASFLTEVSAGAGAGAVRDGSIVIENLSGNVWVCRSLYSSATGEIMAGAGSVTLAGVLDMVRITTVNGTDAFDAGSINILYE